MNIQNAAYHDLGLGAALRELDVPEHREAFFAELEERLADEWRRTHRRNLAVESGR